MTSARRRSQSQNGTAGADAESPGVRWTPIWQGGGERDSLRLPLSTLCGEMAGRYVVITPVRDEQDNLERLARSLESQTLQPVRWVVVDTGSTDGTVALAEQLAESLPWVSVRTSLAAGGMLMRGGPIVRAFHVGLEGLPPFEIVVKQDADVSMDPYYFSRLVEEFEHDDRLGIAGGVAYEQDDDGVWRQRHATGPGVWGASRAYRRACLDEILPLEERMGWDTLDLVAAAVRGWSSRGIQELPFLHHRGEGVRDHSRFSRWAAQGTAAHYMGYRFYYLVLRALFRGARDPAALGVLQGFLAAAARREPRCADDAIRAYVRTEQSLKKLPIRAREALRRGQALEHSGSTTNAFRDPKPPGR